MVNYEIYHSLVKSTYFTIDDTIYPTVKIINGYPMEDATLDDKFIDCFIKSFLDKKNDTVLKVFPMNHPQIKTISDEIINIRKKNLYFFGTYTPLTKTRLNNFVYPRVKEVICYICKFYISQYKQEMTKYRLQLRIYQVLYFIFKEFILLHNNNYDRESAKRALMNLANNFFNKDNTYITNRLMNDVCKYGDVDSKFFNKNFHLSSNIEDYRKSGHIHGIIKINDHRLNRIFISKKKAA